MELTELDGSRDLRLHLSQLRVLIAHDWLVDWRGSERCVEQMFQVFPHADLVVGVLADSVRGLNSVTQKARATWLNRLPGAQRHHRWFLPLEGFAFRTVDTSGYDLVISSSHALSKLVPRPARGLHICYCYSPPRYLWDLHRDYREHGPLVQSLALALTGPFLRQLDRRAAQRVDQFIAISEAVARRIQRAYGRQAAVVFPPVAPKTPATSARARENFLLSFGRLVPYKRVDLAIAAAAQVGMPLVVAGDGPERGKLERLAGPRGGVSFLGEVSDAQAADLLSRCRLFVFCGEEDFGIAPLEANAHGAPVVYYNRGGVAETMRPGATGVPFDTPDAGAVAQAIRVALRQSWRADDLTCNAARFSSDRFVNDFSAAVRRVVASAT